MKRRTFVQNTSAASAGVAFAPALAARCWSAAAPGGTEGRVAEAAITEAARLGADYADCRVSTLRSRGIATRGRRVEQLRSTFSRGFGLRVLVDGSWGFAASPIVSPDEAPRVAAAAVALARANRALQREPVVLAPRPVTRDGSWTTPMQIDPWDVPLAEMIDLLLEVNAEPMRAPPVRFAASSLSFARDETLYVCSEGSSIEQTVCHTEPAVSVTAVSDESGDFQTRDSTEIPPLAAGFEYVIASELPAAARRLGEEAIEKLTAAPVAPGRYDLILHPSNLYLTIHESIGHATELDRALGYEANWGGTSFLAPPEAVLGRFRYGPEFMNVVGDRTSPRALATAGWDHDGVPTRSWHVVRDGIFVDYQTSRDQVHHLTGLTGTDRLHGSCHAATWAGVQFQRMPNVSLLPGEEELSIEDIIGETERGIYVVGSGSYSIDQQRYNFQFGGQLFYEVRDGAIRRVLKDAAYEGRTPEFWNSLDRLGGPSTYMLGGVMDDGKGQPEQLNAVSHGCPVARFRGVSVINTA